MKFTNWYLTEGSVPENPVKDKLGKEIARKLGIVYIGWWPVDEKTGLGGLLTFNDPESDNTTFTARSETEAKNELSKTRAKYKAVQ